MLIKVVQMLPEQISLWQMLPLQMVQWQLSPVDENLSLQFVRHKVNIAEFIELGVVSKEKCTQCSNIYFSKRSLVRHTQLHELINLKQAKTAEQVKNPSQEFMLEVIID